MPQDNHTGVPRRCQGSKGLIVLDQSSLHESFGGHIIEGLLGEWAAVQGGALAVFQSRDAQSEPTPFRIFAALFHGLLLGFRLLGRLDV